MIGNKLRDESDEQTVRELCRAEGIELVAAIPYDESVRQADRRAVALYDYDRASITVRALERLAERFEKQFELLPAEAPLPLASAAAGPLPPPEPEDVAAMTPAEKRKHFPECN